MPVRQDDPFTTYKFTEEEMAKARELSPEQRCYYQTLLADTAAQKLTVTYDAEKPVLIFCQTEAYLRGQMDILNMLLGEGTISRPKNATVPADSSASKPEVSLNPKG